MSVTARSVITADPTRAGKQAKPGSVDRGTGLASVRGEGQPTARHPVVPRHTSIKRKGLAVSWLTHCQNRLSRHWTIRSRS